MPAIRGMQKCCGLTIDQILCRFDSQGRFDYRFTVDVESLTGEATTTILRWAMCQRSPQPHNWSMALLLHDIRFDCVDHEWTVEDHRGHRCSGWHRHMWDAAIENCERKKECLGDFGRFSTFVDFLRDGCALLGIVLEEGGDDSGTLALQFT